MELTLHVVPWNLFLPHGGTIKVQAQVTDTVKDVKNHLATKFTNSQVSNFYFIWAGSVLSDATPLNDYVFKPSSTACLVPPSSLLQGSAEGSLSIIQDLQYHFLPQSQQKNASSLIGLVKSFTLDLSSSEVPWRPSNEEIALLFWAIAALRNSNSPSINKPAVWWFEEYGCALVARATPFGEARLALVCLDSWSFRIHSAPSSRSHNSVPDDHQASILFVGSVPLNDYIPFLERVRNKLKEVKERKKNERTSATGNQGHHKTPGMIQALMLDVLKKSKSTHNSESSEVIPKGGFTDVGLHTGGNARNTSWHLVLAVISHLLDSQEASELLRRVMLQLPLRMAEHSVACFLSEITDSSSNLNRMESDACRRTTDSIMQTLCHVAEEAENFSQIDHWTAEFAMLESRCIRVRYELEHATELRAERIANSYSLPSLSPSEVISRDFKLSILAKTEAHAKESREDIWRIACCNLGLFPAPPSKENTWNDMEKWMNENCISYEGNYLKQLVLCKAVESFFFHKIMNTYNALPKTVEGIMDQYRFVSRELQKSKEIRAVLRVELMSRELLVVWIAFCLVHCAAKVAYPLLSDYSVALCADNLRFLVLSEKTAVTAAQQVTKYLRENVAKQGPIFSLLPSDSTMNFALQQGRLMTDIQNMRVRESQTMRDREERRWNKVLEKKQRLVTLDNELRALQQEYNEVVRERTRLHDEWEENRRVKKPLILRSTEREEKRLLGLIDSKSREIKNEERAPPAILQPLPLDWDLATKVLFFLNMPSDLKVLSRLSFTSQQMLLPTQKVISFNVSPNVSKKLDIDNETSFDQPKTMWYEYYVGKSTANEYGSSATRNRVQLGSLNDVPSDDRWYSSNVRNVSSSSNGVWYPNSLNPALFWNGGECKLDVRKNGRYFNPFRLPEIVTMCKFTEILSSSTKNDAANSLLQWALFQQGDPADARGNYALASQDKMVNWLPNKNAFLEFCAMRAYPLQQVRRLCATLSSRGLPLMNNHVRILMQHAIHQLGEISKEGNKREWHVDLNCFDGWESLRKILDELCDELRSKSREHASILTVGELASQASQWDPDCRNIARKLATIAEKAADDLAEQEINAELTNAPNFRARRCILYMSSLICHSAGELSPNDVAQMCKAHVMADFTKLFEGPTPHDDEVRNLTSVTASVMAARMHEVLKIVYESKQILTEAVKNVHEAAPGEISWKFIGLANNYSSTSAVGDGVDGHTYYIDLNIGTVLVDGRPPIKLPKSILSFPLYVRSFSNRNFEVIRKCGGILATTRRINGKFYEFSELLEGVLIKEIDESDPSSSLELLDATKVDSWGRDLPKMLKLLHSHWLCRKTKTILLRPQYFRERNVQYVITQQVQNTEATSHFASEESSKQLSHANWVCFRIPLHLQKRDWVSENNDLSKLNRLVYLTDDTSQRILSTIRKFERIEGCIQTLRTARNSFLIVLPRFGLEFELTGNGYLKSNSFSSYKLCDRQNFNDTLTDFSEYLILESQGMRRVLIPAGTVCRDSNSIYISASNDIDDNRRFHVYTIHPRFETLHPVAGKLSVEARLQLGALYAATGTLLPEKRVGKTGGEHAIELMRQSWQNCPISEAEMDHLTSICSFGQLYPTLSLLAYELFSSSQDLSFLPFSSTAVGKTISSNSEASTEYALRKRKCQLNPRAFLTDDEENYLFAYAVSRSVRKRQQRGRHIEINEVSAGSILEDVRTLVRGMLRPQERYGDGPEFPFQSSTFGNTSIGNKIATDLYESWNVYANLQGLELSSAYRAEDEELIKTGLVKCSESRKSMETEILLALTRVYGDSMEVSRFNIRRSANLEPHGTRRDLLKMSCDVVSTDLLNPFLTPESDKRVRSMTSEWMQLCVMEDKLFRLLRAVNRKDTNEFVRELQNVDRNWDIKKHPSWLAFEVEEQLQIRDLQYKVADFCLRNPGKITQLNMGEGKTRVILPMLVLELAKRENLMRIHFLFPLLSEAYDYLHHTITASSLNRRFLKLPFHRDVKLSLEQATRILQCLRRCQKNCGAVCVAPEHRLSLLLKKSELDIQDSHSTVALRKVLQEIYDLHYFDLFDESDELLHHRYQLIYAMGSCIPLSSGKDRWICCQAVLQQLQCDHKVGKVLNLVAKRHRFRKRLFPGSMDDIRLLPDFSEQEQEILAKNLAIAISKDPPYYLRWLKEDINIDAIVSFITEKEKDLDWLRKQVKNRKLSEVQTECILALRGILAFGLLRHCMSLRYRVDYGIDPRRETRKVAVPYRGSDTPSNRAEYAHPDILILFTHLAYYYRGLSKDEITAAVQELLNLGPIAQREEYAQWFQGTAGLDGEKIQLIDGVDKLDITNSAQMTLVHRVYQFNMAVISFWLDACILPKETMQFPHRLTANAFHLCDNKDGNIVGFSGTKDNSILLPVQVLQKLPDILQVKATDGKMLDLIVKNEVVHCLSSSVSLSKEVLNLCAQHKTSALIDAGALMAGLENDEVSQRMVSLLEGVDGNYHRGVVYFEKKEASWMVLSLDGRKWPLGSSPVHERDAFVYFDESHCRGADMKLRDTASALLTVGPDMCKDKIMQAAGRMRKLDRGQTLIFAVPPEIAKNMLVATGTSLTSKAVLQWVVGNTAKATAKGLVSWGSQGSLYCTTQDIETKLTDEVLDLEELYHSKVQVKPISEIVNRVQSTRRRHVETKGKAMSDAAAKMMNDIMERAFKYGSDQWVIQSQADEECEREIEHERELEQEKVVSIPIQAPCSQTEWDFGELLRMTEVDDVLRLTNAVSISYAMKTVFRTLKVRGIAWKKCSMYLSSNFISTVKEKDGSDMKNLSNYLRPVDTVIFFHGGECCLLLSEWEADKLLRRVWKYSEEFGEKELLITYTNFTFLFPLEPCEAGAKIHLCIPRTTVTGCDVMANASEYTLAGLQLFGGQTMFFSEERKAALREMLASDVAKRSALTLVSLRGSQRMVARSDLEDICSMNEPG